MTYQIRIRGHLGATMRRAFPGLHAQTQGRDTLLTGPVPDQAARPAAPGRALAGS